MPDLGTEAAPPTKKSLFDRLGAALPIALTALSTALAGLSTSELQRAMFWRTAAGQDQAKATNQWTLAGFKRDRALIMQTSAATLRAQTGYLKETLPPATNAMKPEEKHALEWLAGNGPAQVGLPEIKDEVLVALLEAIRQREPEAELLRKAAHVKHARISDAIDEAEKAVEAIDRMWEPVIHEAAELVRRLALKEGTNAETGRQAAVVQAAGFELEQRRYRMEATLNQKVGFLYEARIKVSVAESDRHRVRSQNFFYVMLAAQLGAVIASLAMARKERSVLWLLAALAGAVAVLGGAYVYLQI